MRQTVGIGISAVIGILLSLFLWQFILPEWQEVIREWFFCIVPIFWVGLVGFTIFLCCYFIYQVIINFRENIKRKI